MYVRRQAESTVKELSQMFGAVLVDGPRQVGKTTMLKQITRGINYVSLDDPIARASAGEEGLTFLKDNEPPVFIDEVQKAPGLFDAIKLRLDSSGKKGQFFLCGSQQFHMMKGVSESLAGRIGLLTLLGFSLREIYSVQFDKPFIPGDEYFDLRKSHTVNIEYGDVWNLIQRGTMPEVIENPQMNPQMYYAAYVRTYIERDVREITEIGNTLKFLEFMIAAAASTGQLLNINSLAGNVGISNTTAQRWLSILTASNIVYLLKPYHNNIIKRAVKTPKLYFLDTGLAAYLTKWTTPDVLKAGAMAGAFFETFVISEVIKSYYNKGILDPPVYFYRDKDQKEIDLLIAGGNTLHPIEIKKHADPSPKDIAAFNVLDKMPGIIRGTGGEICMYDKFATLKGKDKIIPLNMI